MTVNQHKDLSCFSKCELYNKCCANILLSLLPGTDHEVEINVQQRQPFENPNHHFKQNVNILIFRKM